MIPLNLLGDIVDQADWLFEEPTREQINSNWDQLIGQIYSGKVQQRGIIK